MVLNKTDLQKGNHFGVTFALTIVMIKNSTDSF
jgi:hypothetical protein